MMEYITHKAGWADLPLDLLDSVIVRLPLPGDRAHFAAVCRAWRSTAREHERVSYFPWIVLPYGTIYTAGRRGGAACSSFVCPGFPNDTTCLGAAHDCWLALDRTDDVFRRRRLGLQVVHPRPKVKHDHAYMLYNPFSNTTVELPELDAVIGHVAETFEVRKVLMRSPAPDDVIAVTTNNWNCNIILCRPGKGYLVLDKFRVVDAAFIGDILYGITSGEELLAFHLGEDEDGRPNVTRIELVIKNPLAKYYYENAWFWPQQVVDTTSDNKQGFGQDDQLIIDNNTEEGNQEEEEYVYINEGTDDDDDELWEEQVLEDSINGDGRISDNEVFDGFPNGAVFDRFDPEVSYEGDDEIYMSRYIVQSWSGELLLVRHQWQSCVVTSNFTRKVEVMKADFSAGKWVAASAKSEAIFLSRSYSKCTRAHGDIHEGFVYYGKHVDDVFDTTSCTIRNSTLGWPWQCKLYEVTWLFPPEVVV